jgi:hypothetical protein
MRHAHRYYLQINDSLVAISAQSDQLVLINVPLSGLALSKWDVFTTYDWDDTSLHTDRSWGLSDAQKLLKLASATRSENQRFREPNMFQELT